MKGLPTAAAARRGDKLRAGRSARRIDAKARVVDGPQRDAVAAGGGGPELAGVAWSEGSQVDLATRCCAGAQRHRGPVERVEEDVAIGRACPVSPPVVLLPGLAGLLVAGLEFHRAAGPDRAGLAA